jgi:hypothetical protein
VEFLFAILGFLIAAMALWARPQSRRTRWYDRNLETGLQIDNHVRLTSADGDVVEWRSVPRAYFQSNPMLVATRPNSLESLAPGARTLSRANSTWAEAPPKALASTSLVNTYSPGLR